ncbi:hypothetical protein REPUB_Repub01dG0069000 [Reevesia pubescens]
MTRLMDDGGNWHIGPPMIERLAVFYFEDPFSSSSLYNIDEALDDILDPVDVALVKQIQLGRKSRQDMLVWNELDSGNFSTRSAYYVARSKLGYTMNALENRNHVWRFIWEANVKPKVKIFMWRLLNNILPTTSNLECRGLVVNYSEFGNGMDLFIHECDIAETFWNQFLSCAWEKGWLSMALRFSREKERRIRLKFPTLSRFNGLRLPDLFVIMTTSRRLAERKVEKFEKNITKRGAVPETTTKKGKDYPVGPVLLGFFIFVVIGSSLFQIIRTATSGGMA